MSNWQVVILAIVQGITEFLPISSSGHLALLQNLFGIREPPVTFDVFLHVGTLAAVLFYFRKNLSQLPFKIFYLVILGTLPAGLVGLFFEENIKETFTSSRVIGVAFLFTALLLFSTRFLKEGRKVLSGLGFGEALGVGIFQALALFPGVSRSGSTIAAGLGVGLERREAFSFSFYLAIPAVLGALALQGDDLNLLSPLELRQALLGMVLTAGVGFLSLGLLERVLVRGKLSLFALYCFVLGVFSLVGWRAL